MQPGRRVLYVLIGRVLRCEQERVLEALARAGTQLEQEVEKVSSRRRQKDWGTVARVRLNLLCLAWLYGHFMAPWPTRGAGGDAHARRCSLWLTHLSGLDPPLPQAPPSPAYPALPPRARGCGRQLGHAQWVRPRPRTALTSGSPTPPRGPPAAPASKWGGFYVRRQSGGKVGPQRTEKCYSSCTFAPEVPRPSLRADAQKCCRGKPVLRCNSDKNNL